MRLEPKEHSDQRKQWNRYRNGLLGWKHFETTTLAAILNSSIPLSKLPSISVDNFFWYVMYEIFKLIIILEA